MDHAGKFNVAPPAGDCAQRGAAASIALTRA